MSTPGLLPQPVATMNERQLLRRRRLLEAAINLVSEAGADRVQMKQVCDRSGVALGTAYRYFASKDHLLAAALVHWQRLLTDLVLVEVHEGRGAPRASDRVVQFVHRGLRAFEREPEMARLNVDLAVTRDRYAGETMAEMGRATTEAMGALLAEVPQPTRDTVQLVVENAWWGALTAWTTGRVSIGEAFRRTEDIIRLVLAPHDGPAAGDPH